MGLINRFQAGFSAILLFLFALPSLSAQSNSVSVAAEITRLERLSGMATGTSDSSSWERYNAFLSLARLHILSGDWEAALKAYEGALALYPNDGRALLEQGRFLVSLGEYDRAAAALRTLFSREREKGLMIKGRYLAAQLEAFRSGNTGPLAAMAADPEFAEYRSGIYYTLWRLTGLEQYRTRLTADFPHGPEAKIASGSVDFAPTPLWLLFPGRSSIVLAPALAPTTAAPTPTPTPTPTAAPTPAVSGRVLQTGLFSREANAQGQAAQLRNAGFQPQILRRQVNEDERWVVYVPGGRDVNATLRSLKDAGFESFPTTIAN